MKRESVGQGVAVLLVVAVVAVIVGGLVGWFVKPTEEAEVTPKPFEDITLYFVVGAAGDPFDMMMNAGAEYAEETLGFHLEYIHTDWSAIQIVDGFQRALAANPDGIAVIGSPGYAALSDLFAEANTKGIKTALLCVPVPELQEEYRYSCSILGAGFEQGYTLGTGAVRYLDLEPGDRVAVFSASFEEGLGRMDRPNGAHTAFEDAGLIVDIVPHSSDVYGDPSLGIPVVSGYYAAHPDVKVLVFDGGGTTAAAEIYVTELGLGPDDIMVAGFDITPPTIPALEEGYLDIVLDQQQFLQAYLACINLCMSEEFGFAGLNIDCASGLIGQWNFAALRSALERQFGD